VPLRSKPPQVEAAGPRLGAAVQMNLFGDEGWIERTRPPERPGFRWRRMHVAGEHLGASLYELPPARGHSPTTMSLVTMSWDLFSGREGPLWGRSWLPHACHTTPEPAPEAG
jgi:hypothetical protein